MALTSSSTPPTAIPTTRNGNSSSYTSGYSTSAINASGQHRTKRMQNKRNFTMTFALTLRGLAPETLHRRKHSIQGYDCATIAVPFSAPLLPPLA